MNKIIGYGDQNMIDKLNSTKEHREFDVYYAGASLNRVEVIADD